MSAVGRGRAGKYNKPTRGGGKKFSRNLAPLDADGNAMGMWGDSRDAKQASSSEEDSSEEDSESSEDEEQESMTREERRAAAKAKKEALIKKKSQTAAEPGDMPPSSSEELSDDGEDMPANPNHSAKSKRQAASAPAAAGEVPKASSKPKDPSQLSRREKEAIQAHQAKERYQKLHAEGKTDEAKADLARLSLVKEKREMEAARKKAEKEERDAAEAKRAEEMDDKEKKKREAALGGAAKKGKKSVK